MCDRIASLHSTNIKYYLINKVIKPNVIIQNAGKKTKINNKNEINIFN